MPRKGRSNEEIVHALHQVEAGEKVTPPCASPHGTGSFPVPAPVQWSSPRFGTECSTRLIELARSPLIVPCLITSRSYRQDRDAAPAGLRDQLFEPSPEHRRRLSLAGFPLIDHRLTSRADLIGELRLREPELPTYAL